jgi:4-hydroxybenzoate polyprenyltransferase
MPLSEDEQRILREIEEQLHRDPNFARDLSPARSGSRRSLIVSVAGGVLAVAICVLLLAVSPYLAFAAFLAAMAAVVFAERHVRALGDEALRQVAALRRNASGAGRRDPSD